MLDRQIWRKTESEALWPPMSARILILSRFISNVCKARYLISITKPTVCAATACSKVMALRSVVSNAKLTRRSM